MTPNSTRAALAMLASTGRRIATSESFMPECVLSPRTGVTQRLYCKRTGLREIDTSNDPVRSEEHTSELQSQSNLVCRLLLEKKKKKKHEITHRAIYHR